MDANMENLIHIQEVIPRDGFQIEKKFVPTDKKIELINELSTCGLSKIEVTSFVSPKAVPNLKDAEEVATSIERHEEVTYVALVANIRGAERAVATHIDEINLVMSASATHNLNNVRRTHKESSHEFGKIVDRRRGTGIRINGSIATSFGCPFEGAIPEGVVCRFVDTYINMGMD